MSGICFESLGPLESKAKKVHAKCCDPKLFNLRSAVSEPTARLKRLMSISWASIAESDFCPWTINLFLGEQESKLAFVREQPARPGPRFARAQYQTPQYTAAKFSFLLSEAIWKKKNKKIHFSESGWTNQFVQAILLVDSLLTEKKPLIYWRQLEKMLKGKKGKQNLNHFKLRKQTNKKSVSTWACRPSKMV